ncbi:MAG: 27 kDa antigen [Thermoleophilia bacterium]|nr:27 kDa antigen [Thermoleophilia bacterium]
MTSSASSTLTPLAHLPGHFYFTDLHTTDVDAACAFYAGMFGWQFDEIPGAPNRYVPARIDDRSKAAIGGLSEERAAAGTPSHWMPYLNVENVDATITRAQELGGTVTAEAVDVFDMGRMAVLTDPTGARFGIWQDAQPGVTTVKDEHGSPFWYELHTSDLDAALAFYGGLVGWTTDAMQMGPDMTYHLIVPEQVDDVQTGAGGKMGQMQAAREAGAPSQWFSYFNVDDADAAFTKAQEHGARAVMEPHDIPGAGRSCWVEDPTGAQIAMMRPTPPTQAT